MKSKPGLSAFPETEASPRQVVTSTQASFLAGSGEPRVEVEQLLLGPPMRAHQIGRDPEEPRPQGSERRLVTGTPPVRRGEGLRHQVLGQVGANPPGDEPEYLGEVLPKHVLEILGRVDASGYLLTVHK